ncbi:MAG: LPS biosynthesis protein [Armatimonadia bacterium]|nr:LPS biosynthesis protein [Armatimonadia bacterium]
MIDDHPLEIEAMRLFREGRGKDAQKLQEQFLEEVLNSDEDICPCPGSCKHRGDCVACVTIHRGHGDHVPYCMREMINRKLQELSGLTEHSFKLCPEE